MAQSFVLFLILIHASMIFATVTEPMHTFGESRTASSPSPSNHGKWESMAQAPTIRKLGKHKHKFAKFYAEAPHLSPSEAPQTKDDHLNSDKDVSPLAHQGPEGELTQEFHLKKPHHHASVDKSVAGGGVILGGLATTFLVAIFCYIRATRRSSGRPQPGSP